MNQAMTMRRGRGDESIMKRGALWGTGIGVLGFLASLVFQTRAIVMNIGGILAPIAFLVGIVVLLRGASFEDSVGVQDDRKSQCRFRLGLWLVGFSLPPLIMAFLAWGFWPAPHK